MPGVLNAEVVAVSKDDPFHNDELALYHALHAAQNEFRRYLEEEVGMDPAYFSLPLPDGCISMWPARSRKRSLSNHKKRSHRTVSAVELKRKIERIGAKLGSALMIGMQFDSIGDVSRNSKGDTAAGN